MLQFKDSKVLQSVFQKPLVKSMLNSAELASLAKIAEEQKVIRKIRSDANAGKKSRVGGGRGLQGLRGGFRSDQSKTATTAGKGFTPGGGRGNGNFRTPGRGNGKGGKGGKGGRSPQKGTGEARGAADSSAQKE